MYVIYKKLFKLLIEKMKFTKKAGISANTMAKLSRNEYVSMKVLIKMCKALECILDDMIEILPE